MKKLQITARLKIHEGKLNEFKEIAEACLISTRDKDEGTLRYDWFFNEEQTEYVVHELYEDSDALLQHISNLGETFGKVLSVSNMSLDQNSFVIWCCGLITMRASWYPQYCVQYSLTMYKYFYLQNIRYNFCSLAFNKVRLSHRISDR